MLPSAIELKPLRPALLDETPSLATATQELACNAFGFHLVAEWTYWPPTAQYSVELSVVSPCCSEPYREKRERKSRDGWITFTNVCKCCGAKLEEFILPRGFRLKLLCSEGGATPEERRCGALETWVTKLGVDPLTAQLVGAQLDDALTAYCVQAMNDWGWGDEIRAALGDLPETAPC